MRTPSAGALEGHTLLLSHRPALTAAFGGTDPRLDAHFIPAHKPVLPIQRIRAVADLCSPFYDSASEGHEQENLGTLGFGRKRLADNME